MLKPLFISLLIYMIVACTHSTSQSANQEENVMLGIEQTQNYFPKLKGKNVAICVNHTSILGNTHLLDSLIASGIAVKKVFSPEHGFRGTADAGQKIDNEQKATYEIISLYGSNKKPTQEDLRGIDVVVFDLQDVGTRFYTYISTMHYVMEACAEEEVKVMILDRPNPNGHYVDGPVLDTAFRSFVGMHPIPIVHGMTVGEIANMINNEGWLNTSNRCDLEIIPVKNWSHQDPFSLSVKPSPNLPNERSINLYPTLCLFEGTVVSVGRGTDSPFQHIGHPDYPDTSYSFTPKPMTGARYPKLEGEKCFGLDFRTSPNLSRIELEIIIDYYKSLPEKESFFTKYFTLLAGTDQLQKQIENGMTADEIRKTWKEPLDEFRKLRGKYLLYD